MKIPKKITPDNIKDSFIQIIFNPACPPELVIGRFENNLKEVFEFKGGTPPPSQLFKLPNGSEVNFGQFQGGFFLDKNEAVKVTVSPNTLVFSNYQKYPGWEHMLTIITATVQAIFSKGIAESVQRIGVRYISQFDEVSIFDKLKMSLSLDTSNKNFSTTQIRSEFDEDDFKIILNLLNDYNGIENGLQKRFSMTDIDVIKMHESVTNSKEVIESIDKAHFKEKSTFFSLLSPEFLKTLNPEY